MEKQNAASEPPATERQVNKYGRQGEQDRVEAVEHASVAGHDVPRVLHLDAALEHRLNQIAEIPEHDHNSRNHPRVHHGDAVNVRRKEQTGSNGHNAAADGTFPRLLRGNPGEQLVLPELSAHKVGKRVVEPHEQEGVKDNIRLPRPVAHIREIHQQRKRQREIRQYIVTERQVLESVRVLPVQFPNREGEHRCHKEKITVLIPPVIMQETRRKQQHPAHEAHRAVHPHLQPFCQPGKLQYPQHVNDKKKGKETQRVHENTRRQDDDEQQTADSPFHEITQHVPIL